MTSRWEDFTDAVDDRFGLTEIDLRVSGCPFEFEEALTAGPVHGLVVLDEAVHG